MASVDYHSSEQSHYTRDDVSSSSHPHGINHPDSVRSPEGAALSSSLGSAYSNPSGLSLDDAHYNVEPHRTGSALDNEYSTDPSSAISQNDPLSPFGASANEYAPDNSGGLVHSHQLGMGGDSYGIEDDESRTMATHDGVEVQPELDNYVEDVVQPGFDEAILRALCDMDVSVF